MKLNFSVRTYLKTFFLPAWGTHWGSASVVLQVCSKNFLVTFHFKRPGYKPRLYQQCWLLHKSYPELCQVLLIQHRKRELPLAFPVPGLQNKFQTELCFAKKIHLTNEHCICTNNFIPKYAFYTTFWCDH